MKMEKIKYRIGDFAEHLGVKHFIIRFWEKEFHFKANRSGGGQRFYDEEDLQKFKLIKELLYEKKFTLEGAKSELKRINKNKKIIPSQKTTIESLDKEKNIINKELEHQILQLRSQLIKLRELL